MEFFFHNVFQLVVPNSEAIPQSVPRSKLYFLILQNYNLTTPQIASAHKRIASSKVQDTNNLEDYVVGPC